MPLTVAQLRAQLAPLPDEAIVCISSDQEGNVIAPLEDITRGEWNAGDGWYSDGDTLPEGGVLAICLWP